MAWNWIYRMLGMPVRPGEGPTRPEAPLVAPRRLRPLAEEAGPDAAGSDAARAGDARQARLEELRAKHGGERPEPVRQHLETVHRPGSPGPDVRTGPAPSFVIEYRDWEGYPTRRRITIRRVTVDVDEWDNRVGMILAWCHLREDERHFRIDRIQAVIDDDGEVHTDPVRYLSAVLGRDLAADLRP